MPTTISDATEQAYLQGVIDGKRAVLLLSERADASEYDEDERAAYVRGWQEAVREHKR